MLERKKLLASCHLVLMPSSLQKPKVFDTNGRDSSFSSARLHKNGNMALLAHILALGQRSAQKRWAMNVSIQENVVTPDYKRPMKRVDEPLANCLVEHGRRKRNTVLQGNLIGLDAAAGYLPSNCFTCRQGNAQLSQVRNNIARNIYLTVTPSERTLRINRNNIFLCLYTFKQLLYFKEVFMGMTTDGLSYWQTESTSEPPLEASIRDLLDLPAQQFP